jgi:hypothetical protein
VAFDGRMLLGHIAFPGQFRTFRAAVACPQSASFSVDLGAVLRDELPNYVQITFDERLKIHDLLMEGVELVLKKRGYPPLPR